MTENSKRIKSYDYASWDKFDIVSDIYVIYHANSWIRIVGKTFERLILLL